MASVIGCSAGLFVPASQAANWYVAQEATSGLNSGLSWTDAWTSFSAIKWGSVLPGDTIWLSGGPAGGTNNYVGSLSDQLGSPRDGTKSSPITIKVSQDPAHSGLVRVIGGIFISRNYWVVDGSKSAWIPGSVLDTYNVATNCNIEVYQTNATSAVQLFGTGSKVNWVHVSQMTSYDDNAFSMMDGGSSRPVGDGSEIAYCWVSEANGYGIRCEIGSFVADTFGQIAIHHNLIEGTHDNFIQVGGHADIYKNVGRFQAFPVAGHPDVIQEVATYSRIWNNIFSDNQGYGVYVEANGDYTHDILVYNNVFYGTTNGLTSIVNITGHDRDPLTQGTGPCNLSNIWVFNNTAYNLGNQLQTALVLAWNRGENTLRPSGWVSNFWFLNNCIIGVAPQNNQPMIQLFTNEVTWNGITGFTYDPSNVRVDYNCITLASGMGRGIVFGNGGSPQVTNAFATMASFAAATQYKSNNNDTATFLSLPNYDFRIGTGDTALIGRATNLVALLSSIAPEMGQDIVGTQRGTTWDIGAYQYVASGTNGSGGTPPSIAGQPQGATMGVGSTVTFAVGASGTAPLAYQWRFNGINLAGASLSSLVKGNLQLSDAGSYDVVVTNSAGSVISTAAGLTVTNVVTVPTPPVITGQPRSLTNGVGSSISFTVAATGTAPLAYQWRFNGSSIAGASLSSLSKINIQLGDAGSYSVVVTNAAGSVTSVAAVLTVTNAPPPGPAYYVAINGSDSFSTTQARSPSTPWRTIQFAVNMAQPGDTILVTPGNYNEYVETARAGTIGNRITIRAYPPNDPNNQVISKQFRVKHQYITIEGFNLAKAVGLNGAMIRIESPSAFYNGSDCIVTNNTIRDGVMLLTRTASFGTNYIHIRDAYEGTDFNTAGFVPGANVYLGSDSLYPYTNCGGTPIVSSVSSDGLTMFFTTALRPDLGTNYWAAIVAGADGPTSWRGVLTVAPNSGFPGISNIVVSGNTFSNLIGVALDLGVGNTNSVIGNKFTRLHGGYAMRIYAANSEVAYNTIIDSTNIIWFAGDELINPNLHPSGGQYYDWQCNLTTSGGNPGLTNIDFHHNWIQNCENQLGEVDFNATAGNYRVRYCVFVGLMAAGNGSINNLTYDHCTFYRNCYEQYAASTLHFGALPSYGQAFMTNLTITSNVFVDNGGHYSTSQEAPYSLLSCTNETLGNNFSVFGETMGWSNTPPTAGTFGSGDPVFVNARDPLGPDGLPFTDDDGLRPLPNSPVAALGLGALPPLPATSPVAHFSVQLASPGWKDATGINFNPAYAALKPHERTGVMRPWNTPEALGAAPVMVTFDASKSIDGFGTNNAAITSYAWQFSDGGTTLSSQPTISHTFQTVGTNTVTLWITNSAGGFASYANVYRTLLGTNILARPTPPSGLRVIAGLP